MNNKHTKIRNLQELKAEISRLKALKNEQEVYLKTQFTLLNNKIEAPIRFFNTLKDNIPGVNIVQQLFSKSSNPDSDWLTKTLRIGVPFVMNRLFLKNTGVFKKALMLLLSERAVGQINQDKISGLLSKLTQFIRPKKKKNKAAQAENAVIKDEVNEYGIPSYSETY
ncbi:MULTISPECIES: hypothetical protein [Sphingobacterium]|jgi:hypothetical protein|uniref:Uncharacterized protein n=2 Tax=Sphingobacterium TaxID=28453 RepID=A0A562MD94_9SPHI|nr:MULTISPECIES: hypothetical protein [Sphingobacterium]APU94921.1 hypothetical protein BV902_00075 [Sphingobacterium sp. B29]MBB1644509.1 hypothetical protein [Sphingobacterium sp. UME9]MCS4168320.1 hypothetical protein [Sphingobacterium sp. BIGb0116]QMV70108.1 hypothetical protein HS960_21715 [Sphingobacterium paramultivorum]QRY58665.1 hypothetical protein JVX97_04135 [Sphingobacterium siyangense]